MKIMKQNQTEIQWIGQKQSYLLQLQNIILAHEIIKKFLMLLREIEPQAFIAAGCIRNLVWASLHDQEYILDGTEIDVIFYDSHDDGAYGQAIETQLRKIFPCIEWDITNQALVHEWYTTEQGESIPPLTSIKHALSLWPETATAIAVRLNDCDEIEYIAPFGLDDLFELKLRWNSTFVQQETFMKRLQQKRFLEKWPKLVMQKLKPSK